MGHETTRPVCAVSHRPRETASETGALVAAAQSGDMRAYDALVRRFQDMAVGYGAAILHDFHLAEDAAQEAFLETCRALPGLRNPEAFPAYLRLCLRKHCDRITRRKRLPTVPLEQALETVGVGDAACPVLEERQQVLRQAVRGLPEAERVVIVLFYIGERSLKEVAGFLDLPISTVKNRLHSARRRLRERMQTMMDEIQRDESLMEATLSEQRPSNSDRFRGQIIDRLYDTYVQQFRENMQSADRTLLTQARQELDAALTDGRLDAETAHAGVRLLIWMRDFAAIPEIMERYLSQSLPPAEEFWARWTHIRGLAARRSAEAVVTEQRALMSWVREHVPGDPPIRLSEQEPFAPTNDPTAEILPPDALSVFALGIYEIGLCFQEAGKLDEWLTIATSAIDAAPKTASNRLWRFYKLRHEVHLLASIGRRDEARSLLSSIRALADEENDWQAPRWPIEALLMELRMRADAKDSAGARSVGTEAIALLEAYRQQSDPESREQRSVLRLLTNNLAAPLTGSGNYDLALPLWEKTATPRLAVEWSYLWYAECVWATTRDREKTLELLREAASMRYDNELRDWFMNNAAGFADVRNDPEFLAALNASSR